MPASPRRALARAILLVALLVGLAGCDKCGNRININAPSLQHACGDNAGPAR